MVQPTVTELAQDAYGQPLPPMTAAFWMFPALPLLLALFLIFLVSFLVQFFFSRFEITRKGREGGGK